MKNTIRPLLAAFACMAAAATFQGCQENVDESARYIFKHDLILSYLEKHEVYSEYVALLKQVPISAMSESSVAQLLSARGHYTCFAPTNEAIKVYLQDLVAQDIIERPSWDAFSDSMQLDSVRKVIVYNSVIDSGDEDFYETSTFPVTNNAEFPISNMNGRKLTVNYVEGSTDSILIDGKNLIDFRNRDIPALNGVIHQMRSVVAPSIVSLGGILRKVLEKGQGPYLVMAKCIRECGFLDTLDAVRDEVYEKLYTSGQLQSRVYIESLGLKSTTDGFGYLPEHRKYGFTIFAEPDSWWEMVLGKPAMDVTPEDVQQWVEEQNFYPEALANEDYKSEENLLNQWVSYHILPYRLPSDRLVFHYAEKGYNRNNPSVYTIPVMEHYTTLGKRRLMRIYESAESQGVYLNRFPFYNNGRTENGHERFCLPSRVGARVYKEDPNLMDYSMENGLIYSIDAPLAYSDSVRDCLSRERLRIEGMSLFPEVMNNDIRRMPLSTAKFQNVLFPDDTQYRYLENLSINEGTTFVYYNAYNLGWGNYQGDEIKGVGRYELTFKLPPVARKGVYEVRYRVLTNGNRGVAQLYFGSNPENLPVAGIPIDLTVGGSNRLSGWEEDTEDQDHNAEIDKQMRNNGFMKGELGVTNGSKDCRSTSYKHVVRRIITRQTLDPDKTYYLKIKSVLDSDKMEFYMDHVEICPKEIYDNPNTPEDIW